MEMILVVLIGLALLQMSSSAVRSIDSLRVLHLMRNANFKDSSSFFLSPYMAHLLLFNSVVIIGIVSINIQFSERLLVSVCPFLTQCVLCFYFVFEMTLEKNGFGIRHLANDSITFGSGFLIGILSFGYSLLNKNRINEEMN